MKLDILPFEAIKLVIDCLSRFPHLNSLPLLRRTRCVLADFNLDVSLYSSSSPSFHLFRYRSCCHQHYTNPMTCGTSQSGYSKLHGPNPLPTALTFSGKRPLLPVPLAQKVLADTVTIGHFSASSKTRKAGKDNGINVPLSPGLHCRRAFPPQYLHPQMPRHDPPIDLSTIQHRHGPSCRHCTLAKPAGGGRCHSSIAYCMHSRKKQSRTP